MKKRLFLGIFLLLIIPLMHVFSVDAYEIPIANNDFYANDFADIMSEDTEEYIVKVNEELYSKTGAQVMVTTIQTLGDAPLEEYATEMFREYGIGSKEENNGVLILLALEDRACRIEVGYGLEGVLNDAKTGRIQDDYMIPYFKDGKWDEGLKNGFDAILSEVVNEYNIEIDYNAPVKVEKEVETKEHVPWNKDSNTVGMIGMAIALIVGLLWGAICPSFWIGLLGVILIPVFGHIGLTSYLPGIDGFLLILSDFGMLITGFIGWAITTDTVDTSGSSGYSGSGSYSGSSRSSYSSSSSHSSSRHNSGGGGRSGGGGSSRRF